MKYKELTIYTTAEGEELIANALFECGADGVLIENRDEIIKIANEKVNFDYIEEEFLQNLSKVVLLKMFIDENTFETIYPEIKSSLENLRNATAGFISLGSLETTVTVIDDVDYINVWKQHYKPIDFNTIAVCPKWLESTKPADKTVYLDPGTAFGTGNHETTAVVLALLEKENVEGKLVADIGTGSGILGIAAAKLGAKSVYMCDIDPEAVKVSKENAEYNGVLDACIIEENNLSDGVNFSPDIVLANITADILIMMSGSIASIMNSEKILILSGILNEKLQEVKDAYIACGFEIKTSISQKEWSGITLIKK
ncbi:MAG: 50S ribosomal protein L11 methyltransferase [Bacillota bacterium]